MGGAEESGRAATPAPEPELAPQDNTTLLQNDEESFALAPVDATVLRGTLGAIACTLLPITRCQLRGAKRIASSSAKLRIIKTFIVTESGSE